jgi:hypothetical protein
MTDHTNTYPDLVSVEDWLAAKGYTGEAGACHQAMSLIRSQEKCIADLRKEADMMHSEYKTAITCINDLKAALKPFADKATEYAAKWEPIVPPDSDMDWMPVSITELNAARAALENKNV